MTPHNVHLLTCTHFYFRRITSIFPLAISPCHLPHHTSYTPHPNLKLHRALSPRPSGRRMRCVHHLRPSPPRFQRSRPAPHIIFILGEPRAPIPRRFEKRDSTRYLCGPHQPQARRLHTVRGRRCRIVAPSSEPPLLVVERQRRWRRRVEGGVVLWRRRPRRCRCVLRWL